jgi:long-chain acyl-CoA synthetase
MRFIQSTGSPLEENLLLEIEQTYGAEVITSYSLTEASHLTTTNIPKRTRKLGSVGSPVNGISCMIVNEKNEKVPSGIGEICICGPTVFKGYFGKEKGGNFFEYDKRTWFKTGI